MDLFLPLSSEGANIRMFLKLARRYFVSHNDVGDITSLSPINFGREVSFLVFLNHVFFQANIHMVDLPKFINWSLQGMY